MYFKQGNFWTEISGPYGTSIAQFKYGFVLFMVNKYCAHVLLYLACVHR